MAMAERRLMFPFEWGGWELRTAGGATFFIVADGVEFKEDPYVFRTLVQLATSRELMPVARIPAHLAPRVFSSQKVPYELPPKASQPLIVSNPIPTWCVTLTDGTALEVAADKFRSFGRWAEFSFRVEDDGRQWHEPVMFVRSKWFASAELVER